MIITLQCKECDNDQLDVLPEPYSHIAECSKCGHPNDVADTSQEPE